MTKQPGLQQYCQPGPQLRAAEASPGMRLGSTRRYGKEKFHFLCAGSAAQSLGQPAGGRPLSATVCAQVSRLQALGQRLPCPSRQAT